MNAYLSSFHVAREKIPKRFAATLGAARFHPITDHALGAGQTGKGRSRRTDFDLTTELNDFKSERFGVFGNATYRFSTF